MSEKKKIPEWHRDLHEIIRKYLIDTEVDAPDILAYLTLALIGTVEGNGFSEEFFKAMLDTMLEEFRRKRKVRLESGNGMD